MEVEGGLALGRSDRGLYGLPAVRRHIEFVGVDMRGGLILNDPDCMYGVVLRNSCVSGPVSDVVSGVSTGIVIANTSFLLLENSRVELDADETQEPFDCAILNVNCPNVRVAGPGSRLVSKEAPHVLSQNPAEFMKPVIIEHEVSLVPSDAAVQRMCAHCRFVNKKDNLSSFACPKTQLRFYVCNKSCQTAFYKEHKKRLGDGRWQGGNCTYA